MYEYNALVLNVVDGDTLDVLFDLGFNVKIKQTIRMIRINAYETKLGKATTKEEKQIGLNAKQYVKNLLEGKNVVIKTTKLDNYEKFGRFLGEVFYKKDGVDTNLNDELVTLKYAIYKDY